ncbi:magnesium transporter [Fretibacterium fastidiosum]|uniref:Magnesium transporter MgtE n=1 Tax=Fretibacterium fastidiosum TaxID=651822 RepID=A0AB94IWG7_9BACT|nr:magnesium transporter [Fretibacterium fastidiosum]CBL28093.1 Mg2+ transporter (mgtE) [Fretibacterium fastidiosum]
MDHTRTIPAEESASTAQHPNYEEKIAQVVRGNLTPKIMREQLLTYHENDVAAALDLLKKEDRYRLYSVLNPETLADVLEYSEKINEYVGELNLRKRAEVLAHLEPSVAVDYLQEVEKGERAAIIDLMPDDAKQEISLLSSFDEDEIGSRMTTNFVMIHMGISVRQAMRELVEQAADNDNISTIYVADDDGIFAGAIDLKSLIIAREGTELDSIIMTSYPYVYANELIEDCIERIKDYSEDSIPVLDQENRLKGVLTAQDVAELIDDEMGEDYARLAGLTAEEDLQEPLSMSIVKRLPWLLVLLGLGLVVSSVVGLFEAVAAGLTIIVAFQSLILDMAGNVGTQSLAVTIRVLMDDQCTGRQKLYLVAKEAKIGLCNGLILGSLSILFIGLYLLLVKGEAAHFAFSISLCAGAALALSMSLSSISGTTIPILFKGLGVDPAVASGPLITTVNDLIAVVTYYGLAEGLLRGVLGG